MQKSIAGRLQGEKQGGCRERNKEAAGREIKGGCRERNKGRLHGEKQGGCRGRNKEAAGRLKGDHQQARGGPGVRTSGCTCPLARVYFQAFN